jgi:hypothetical protein
MKYSVQQLLECVLATRDLRAKREDSTVGLPTDCLVDLLDTVYSEWRESFLQPLQWKYRSTDGGPFQEVNEHEDVAEQMGAYPEELLLRNLFVLFLDHLDEEVVRELFAELGPKPPRLKSAQQEEFLFQLYMHEDLPPKAQFARRVADFNKEAPADMRLGSGSMSEINLLRYIDRMLDKENRREEVASRKEMMRLNGKRLNAAIGPLTIGGIQKAFYRYGWSITKNKARHFPRKMSRQT